jgi:4-methylaminobutanoate oxidase (formaldehyde-forming)
LNDYIEIGGGIIGLSTAYHLTELGYNNVVVIERDEITSGTTWHSNGKGILEDICRK